MNICRCIKKSIAVHSVFLKQTDEFNHLFQKDPDKTASAARILSPNPMWRPSPCLLNKSFFYALKPRLTLCNRSFKDCISIPTSGAFRLWVPFSLRPRGWFSTWSLGGRYPLPGIPPCSYYRRLRGWISTWRLGGRYPLPESSPCSFSWRRMILYLESWRTLSTARKPSLLSPWTQDSCRGGCSWSRVFRVKLYNKNNAEKVCFCLTL